METHPAKQNYCYVHFTYFWLPYTANKSTTCAAASTGIFSFTECMCTAEKDSYSVLDCWLRTFFPCSRVVHCMVAAWSIGRSFLAITFQSTGLTAQKVLMVDESQSLTQRTPHNKRHCQTSKFVFTVAHICTTLQQAKCCTMLGSFPCRKCVFC